MALFQKGLMLHILSRFRTF